MDRKRKNCHIKLNIPLKFARISLACLMLCFLGGYMSAKSPEAKPVNDVKQSGATISGKIVDANGDPIIGATVAVKGSSNGTMTDLDGAFSLKNVDSNATLSISYLGYTTQDVKVGDKKVFNIELKEDPHILDEVVVEVGYGSVKRANLLGAVSNMTTDDIKDLPTPNLTESLYGKLPGVNISSNNGTPGTTPTLTIRKNSTYSGTQQPLFIIDGIDRGYDPSFFNMLDANDVENISVLKDAAAAVYGARGVGGVVIVKTKSGKEGKPKLSYSGSIGISDRTSFPELMSSQEFATYLNDGLDTYLKRYTTPYLGMTTEQFRQSDAVYSSNVDNRWRYFTEADMAEIEKRNFDWLDKYWSSSMITKHNLNLSGGTKDISYYTSASYQKQDGNISNFNIEQYSVRVGVEAKIIAGLKGRFSLDMNSKYKRLPYNKADSSDGTMKSTFQSLMRTPRWMPYEVDGRLVYYETGVDKYNLPQAKDATVSHIAAIGDSFVKSKDTNVSLNFGFSYDFSDIETLKGLKASLSYARTESNSNQKQYRTNYNLYKLASFDVAPDQQGRIPSLTEFAMDDNGLPQTTNIDNGNRYSDSSNSSWYHQFNIGLEYARKIFEHNLHVMLNYEEQENSGSGFNMFRENMLVYGWPNFNAFGGDRDGAGSYSAGARKALIGRLNYDYSGKYLLETSFRYESSSSFPKDKRWGFFPSVSGGWRLSEESWFNIDFIDNAKLRTAVGLVGQDRAVFSQWHYLYEAASTGGYLGGSPLNGLKPALSGVKNADLKWETTFFSNYGVDLRLFRDFDFSFDYWIKNTWDIADQSSSDLPQSVGVVKMPVRNYGHARAWGYDVSLSYNGRINKDMKYRVGGNLSWSDTRIAKIIQDQGNIGTWRDRVGRRMDSGIEGYKCLGIIRTQEQLDALFAVNPNYTIFGKTPELGMLYYEDIGGGAEGKPDGIIDEADLMRLKNISSNPYNFGLSLGFTWKDLDFSAQFTGGFGGWAIMNKNDYAHPTVAANGLKMWADHWTLDNPDASMPRASLSGYDVMNPSSFWIKRGTQMRLRNASISYHVPRTVYSKAGLSDVRFYVSATNLFTLISPFDYKDPSLSYFDSYPIMRTFNFGLNVSF